MTAAFVLALAPALACDGAPVARPAVAVVVPRPDPVAWEKARKRKLLGLDTPKARAEYVHILADACEYRHDPLACVEAATVDRKLGRTLLFHGCSLGEDAACAAYMKAEMTEDRRDRAHALADAQLALAQGCAYSGGNACAVLSRWNGESSPPSAPASPSYADLKRAHVEDIRIAEVACTLTCTEQQKECISRCSKSPVDPRRCVDGCARVSQDCAGGCQAAAKDACVMLHRQDCGLLDRP